MPPPQPRRRRRTRRPYLSYKAQRPRLRQEPGEEARGRRHGLRREADHSRRRSAEKQSNQVAHSPRPPCYNGAATDPQLASARSRSPRPGGRGTCESNPSRRRWLFTTPAMRASHASERGCGRSGPASSLHRPLPLDPSAMSLWGPWQHSSGYLARLRPSTVRRAVPSICAARGCRRPCRVNGETSVAWGCFATQLTLLQPNFQHPKAELSQC